ncbi:MAG: DNA polymerase III subunit chi [Arenibacterium sp.]
MGEAYFYHLTRGPLEQTLPILLGKARSAGWRITVRGRDRSHMEWLDEKLWLGADDGFLPHGLEGGAHDREQPILLTTGEGGANKPDCLMAVEGAAVDAEEVTKLARVCILFDGNDPSAVQGARDQWKALTAAGCAAQYWSEESGRWQKKAESGGGTSG